jgi:hypothetical protein
MPKRSTRVSVKVAPAANSIGATQESISPDSACSSGSSARSSSGRAAAAQQKENATPWR